MFLFYDEDAKNKQETHRVSFFFIQYNTPCVTDMNISHTCVGRNIEQNSQSKTKTIYSENQIRSNYD